MTTPAIQLTSVRKDFGSHRVLKDVTLTVPTGETFAFLGRNAAGKTTTIRMLLGLLKPSEAPGEAGGSGGSVRVLGIDPAVHPLTIRGRVGYLAEDQQMYGWMRVEQMIRFMAPFYPTWDHDLAKDYLKRFDLPAWTKIRHLSKGQNVRLGLLLALAHRPELVILDDPALGLDPIMRKEFNRDLITHLQGEGRTVFYSSHLLYEVEPIADTVAILHNGVIVKQAGTEALREQVKRIVLPKQDYDRLETPAGLLDLAQRNGEAAITLEDPGEVIASLQASGTSYRVVDLNLDEIFEAYVAGDTESKQVEETV